MPSKELEIPSRGSRWNYNDLPYSPPYPPPSFDALAPLTDFIIIFSPPVDAEGQIAEQKENWDFLFLGIYNGISRPPSPLLFPDLSESSLLEVRMIESNVKVDIGDSRCHF